MDLLTTNRTLGAHIEFTTKCNLKCVYCGVQIKGYVGKDLDLNSLQMFIDQLESRNILEITVSGHGETTTVDNWHLYCDQLLERGYKLDIITNLSKKLTSAELETLAKFNFILVSCDSVDLHIFKSLRRGSDFRNVLYNMVSVQNKARQIGINPPRLGWATVVCDKNVFNLVDMVNFGLTLGIKFFYFSNVVIYKDSSNIDSYIHITEMPENQKRLIPGIFDQIEQLLIDSSVEYEFAPGVRESIEKIRCGEQLISEGDKKQFRNCVIYRENKSTTDGLTRDCLDPWWQVRLRPGGTIHPCFVSEDIMGSLNEEATLNEILNGPVIKRYREGLLTGKLVQTCVNCHCKGWISISEMEHKVSEYFRNYDTNNEIFESSKKSSRITIKSYAKLAISFFSSKLRRIANLFTKASVSVKSISGKKISN
jgi:MoaA/NifB/PqqE/SkfB family radical SAM enzyme